MRLGSSVADSDSNTMMRNTLLPLWTALCHVQLPLAEAVDLIYEECPSKPAGTIRNTRKAPSWNRWLPIIAFYPQHIWKEEYLVFPAARQLLSAAEQEEIARGLCGVESKIGPDIHRAFEALARSAEDAVSRAEMADFFAIN